MSDINNSLYRVLDKFKLAFGISNILPGSKLHQIAESIALESTISEDYINNYIKENSLMTATSFTLDAIGENHFGIKRIKMAKPVITTSMKCIKFYTNNGVSFGEINKDASELLRDIVVPEGTLITGSYNGTEYVFRTTSRLVLDKSLNIGYVAAEMSIGSNTTLPSGTLKAHSFTGYTNAASKLLLVTNATAIGTGRDEESDDNYRYRLTNAVKAGSQSSYFGIRNSLLALPGVSNIEIVNGAYGGGTFAVFVQGITPITSDDLIQTVKDHLGAMVPAWCTYTVNSPRYIGITLKLSINSGSNPLTDRAVQSIVNAITENVNNFYGNAFNILTLQQMAANASSEVFSAIVSSVQIYSGSGDLRLYEEMTLDSTSNTINLSQLDKLIIEPNIVDPIKIVQVI
jgi:uncharacterized phage protein gp47/JayE